MKFRGVEILDKYLGFKGWECLECGARGIGEAKELSDHLENHIIERAKQRELEDFNETNCNWGE